MADSQNKTADTERRLDELAGPETIDSTLFRERVWHWMCPCTSGSTCRWPTCAGIGNGIGHYP